MQRLWQKWKNGELFNLFLSIKIADLCFFESHLARESPTETCRQGHPPKAFSKVCRGAEGAYCTVDSTRLPASRGVMRMVYG